MVKDLYACTNRRQWIAQILERLGRLETIRNYSEFLAWNDKETARIKKINGGAAESGGGNENQSRAVDETETEDESNYDEEDDTVERGQDVVAQLQIDHSRELGEHPEPEEHPELEEQRWEDADVGNEQDSTANYPTTSTKLYRVAKTPAIRRAIIGNIMRELEIPKFIHHLRDHPYLGGLPIVIDESSRINIWTQMKLRIPPSIYHNTIDESRVSSHPAINHPGAIQQDAIFYVPTNKPGQRIPEAEVMHGM
ncbi:hypothetical protein FRC06_011821 [Ceratobasidium sp. 370]|nr:hypothetical protein FRC06_011821 [Ceratobasidium sp. 370]